MKKIRLQFLLVIVLNIVIICLLCGLFLLDGTVNSGNNNPVANLPDIYTMWETNLSDSNDVPVASFVSKDRNSIHIFGNTSDPQSGDSIFFAEVSEGTVSKKINLDISSKLSEASSNIYNVTLKKACIADVGYMLALQGTMNTSGGSIDVSFVAAVDQEGNLLNLDLHTVISPERIIDAFYADSKLFLIVQTGYSDLKINNIKVYRYSTDVKLETSLSADHLGNMEYLFLSAYREGYLLCFNVSSLSHNCVAFAYIITGTNATFSYADMSVGYKALDFTVTKNGYALLCLDDNGNSFLLSLSNNFQITNTAYYPNEGNNKNIGKIIYTEKGYFIYSGAADRLYLYDINMNQSKQLENCDSLCDACELGTITVTSAIVDDDIRLYIFDAKDKIINLKLAGTQTQATILKLNSGLVIVSDSITSEKKSCTVVHLNSDALICV